MVSGVNILHKKIKRKVYFLYFISGVMTDKDFNLIKSIMIYLPRSDLYPTVLKKPWMLIDRLTELDLY